MTDISKNAESQQSCIAAVISRLLSVIFFIIFCVVLTFMSLSQYWLIHWILFGRNVYKDSWHIVDKYQLNEL